MKLDHNIQAAFEQIHADDELKQKTKTFVYRRTNHFGRARAIKARRLVAIAACVLVLVFTMGGYFSYAYPVAAVSIDVNPSVELQINLYHKVIDIKGYNADGIALANQLSVKNLDYTDAIHDILTNEAMASCLASDELLEITVTSKWQNMESEMQRCISQQTGVGSEHIYCLKNEDEIEAAHAANLSFGKYRVYLELYEINPDITTDDIRNLTMREIRDMIEAQRSDSADSDEKNYGGESGLGNGQGNGQGNMQGTGQANGMQNGLKNKYGNTNKNGNGQEKESDE